MLQAVKLVVLLKVVDWIQPAAGTGCVPVVSARGQSLQEPDFMERPIGIEPTPEPWQGSVLPLY
jgi:hypothetical protein